MNRLELARLGREIATEALRERGFRVRASDEKSRERELVAQSADGRQLRVIVRSISDRNTPYLWEDVIEPDLVIIVVRFLGERRVLYLVRGAEWCGQREFFSKLHDRTRHGRPYIRMSLAAKYDDQLAREYGFERRVEDLLRELAAGQGALPPR